MGQSTGFSAKTVFHFLLGCIVMVTCVHMICSGAARGEQIRTLTLLRSFLHLCDIIQLHWLIKAENSLLVPVKSWESCRENLFDYVSMSFYFSHVTGGFQPGLLVFPLSIKPVFKISWLCQLLKKCSFNKRFYFIGHKQQINSPHWLDAWANLMNIIWLLIFS